MRNTGNTFVEQFNGLEQRGWELLCKLTCLQQYTVNVNLPSNLFRKGLKFLGGLQAVP